MLKKLLVGIFVAAACLAVPQRASASVQDFVVKNFEADYSLSNKDKQGELRVTEKIDVLFSDYNHGIERFVPKVYKENSLHVKVLSVHSASGAPSQFTTYSSNNNLVIRIGDPNRTVTGAQSYEIVYSMTNVTTLYEDHDEFYWDINGDQWLQPFEHVKMTLRLPPELKTNGQFACYAGIYGSKRTGCSISDQGSVIVSETKTPLEPAETLTMIVGFSKGYFAAPTAYEKLREHLAELIALILVPAVILPYVYMRWRRYGRDPKGKGTIVPEYEAPDNLRPIEIGALLDFKADTKDLSATLIDLAVRGYIKIIETVEKRKFGKDKTTYSFEITKKPTKELLEFERTLLEGLQKHAKTDEATGKEVVQIADLKQKFYTTANKVLSIASKGMVEKQYFASNPLTAGGRLYGLFVLCIVGAIALGRVSPAFILSFIVCALVSFGFALVMSRRTEKGVAALEKAKGLKLYIETAEKDRIAMMQSPNAPYASSAGQPKRTVELFEKLLPYAMVLKVEKEWAKQFEGIYTSPPDWYSGNWSTFNAVYLVSSLDKTMSVVNTTAMSTPSSSGSSGFSGGGGGAGGGGGGGGGGGW